RQIGHIRAYSAAAAIYAVGILSMGLAFDPVAWGVFRLFQGAASAIMFASAESWIADSTPRSKRGGVMGLYQLMLKVAMSFGPILIVDHAADDIRPFIWAGLLMTLALIPLCATRRAQPVLPDREALTLSGIFKIPPAALMGSIVAGVCNTGVTTQLPLYAKDLQPGAAGASAATLYIAAMVGGTLTQWPAGLISDRVDRRFVVATLAAVALGACIALYLTAGKVSFSITVLLAALWGAGALSFYSVSAAHATDRTEPGQITQAMSGMLFIWAGASVLGPLLTGVVADTKAGQPGVFAAVAVGYFALMIANLWRLFIKDRPGPARRHPFQPVSSTSVVQGKVADDAERPASAD
ncbi:MAG: MFS transporter, partial [Hyphomonadaceae bacterium]|nr:MFS transporter [Hyphomonadaceae bacterium]